MKRSAAVATQSAAERGWDRGRIAAGGLGALLLVGSALLTPERMIALGPMRTSLTHEIASVRRMAELEVQVATMLLMTTGLLLVGASLSWTWLSKSNLLRALREHRPTRPRPRLSRGQIADGSLWVMSALTVVCIAYLALAAGPLAPSVGWVAKESGLVEQLTALFFLVASGLAGVTAHRARPGGRKVLPALLALGFFMCFGEEISWGQHLLGYVTPEAIAEHNVQGEANVHNLMGYAADHLFIAGVFCWGFALPLITAASPIVHNLTDKIGLPVASIGLALGFGIASSMHDWTLYRFIPHSSARIPEFREFLSGLGFLLLMMQAAKAAGPALEAPSTVG